MGGGGGGGGGRPEHALNAESKFGSSFMAERRIMYKNVTRACVDI